MSKSSKHKRKINLNKTNGASSLDSNKKAWNIKTIAIISILAIAVLIGVVGVACNLQKEETNPIPNTPEAVAKEFMEAYCTYDAEKMLPCYPDFIWANDDSQKAVLLEILQSFLNDVADYNTPSYEITEIFVPTEEELLPEKEALEVYAKIIDGFDLSKIIEYRFANVVTYNKTNIGQKYDDEITLVLINYDGEWCVIFPYFL